MPRRFRGWFLEDDIIFFRTRAPSYLTTVATNRQREQEFRTACEQLGKLINARNQTILNDTYSAACRFWWVALAIHMVFIFPIIWKVMPGTLIQEPIVNRLGTAAGVFCVWLVFVLAVPYFAALCALPFEVHAYWLYKRDYSALFRDMVRSWFGLQRELPPHIGPGQLGIIGDLEARFGASDVESTLRRIYCCIDNHNDGNGECPHKSPIVTSRMWLWLLSATFRSTWCGGLTSCIQALRSFWAFHRKITTTGNMSNGILDGSYRAPNRHRVRQANNSPNTQMLPVIKRAKMLERGDLVVCLKPYPDLVNVTGLGWLNQLYLSYRAWQRWLLAERVYHDLEMETGKQQATLKIVMFHSVAKLEGGLGVRFRSRLGDAGDDVDGQEYLVVETPIGENEQQRGKWLR